MTAADRADAFETWRRLRETQGGSVTIVDLYELVAGSRGIPAEELPLEERQILGERALQVLDPGFQLGPNSERAEVEPVELVTYDPTWPAQFEAWKKKILVVLPKPARRIEHVGSTAVPGLRAKAVIDIQMSVDDFTDWLAYRPALESLGLQLRSRDSHHSYFRPCTGQRREIHVHVCNTGGAWERRHILFRDYLRSNTRARATYLRTKENAAARWGDDRLAYTEAKSDSIARLMNEADEWAKATKWSVAVSR